MSKNPNDRDVTWGDNVIYANFSGAERGRSAKRVRSASRGSIAVSSAIEKLRQSANWADAGVSRMGRGMRSVVTPRTTFSQWIWEFICKDVDDGRRLRGEQYFKKGAVVGMKLGDGFVVGEVQGSQLDPFSVYIRFPRRDIAAVDDVLQWLVDNPRHIEGFERGELPFEQMKQLVSDVDENLFFDCSCPDPHPACKHVVAIGAQLVQQLDDDPMSLLEIRGFQPRDVQRRMKELVERKTAESRRPAGILQRRLQRGNRPVGTPGTETSGSEAPGSETHSAEAVTSQPGFATNIRALPADFWGNDLPRVEVPELEPIDPLKLTDQSLLHEALLPTCILSRETLRAVSDLEDCWNHMKSSISLTQREQQW